MTKFEKEIKVTAGPEVRQFYYSMLASLTTTLIIALISAVQKRQKTTPEEV